MSLNLHYNPCLNSGDVFVWPSSVSVAPSREERKPAAGDRAPAGPGAGADGVDPEPAAGDPALPDGRGRQQSTDGGTGIRGTDQPGAALPGQQARAHPGRQRRQPAGGASRHAEGEAEEGSRREIGSARAGDEMPGDERRPGRREWRSAARAGRQRAHAGRAEGANGGAHAGNGGADAQQVERRDRRPQLQGLRAREARAGERAARERDAATAAETGARRRAAAAEEQRLAHELVVVR